ncbi:Cadherin-89D [Trichostrongylus colubriformis]|uniref:Cadherin-89D n=1 Tax=Trichostrongylus colubriformis TaxID=6319 RepID=A0AAN8IQV5_TRICO
MTVRLIFLLSFIPPTLGCLLENGGSAVYLSVAEDVKPGSVIGHLPIRGSTTGTKPDMKLRVVKGSDIGRIVPGSKDLILEKKLDRDEGQSKLELVVECVSQNLHSDFSQLNISVFVTVQDVNDNAPVFDAPEYNITIKEELPKDTIVFTDFEVTDRDQPGPNSFILYSIAEGPYSDLLEIADPFRPLVTIKNRIDYEKIRSFDVILEARDQGEPPLSTTAPLHVTVEDVNDLPPYFPHQYYTCHNVKDGELILEPEAIKAYDGDALDADIEYGMFGEFSHYFSIDSNGKITVKTSPPPPRATFFVYAYEKDNPEKNSTAIVSLSLEKSIRFEHDSYSIRITSSIPLHTVLLTVKAFSNRGVPVRYSLGNVNAAVSVGETTGQLTFAGSPKIKAGILQYELLATNRIETAKAKLTVVVDTESSCCSRMEFEKPEYHLQMGSLPVIGTINVRGQRKPTYRLMNMNKYFVVDQDGVVRLELGSHPPCATCELVVLATRDDGATTVAKIVVKNPSFATTSSSILTVMISVILAMIFALLLIFVFRKSHYAWRSQRRANICWMNNTSDTGITITGTMPNSTSRHYVVNADTEKTFEASKSPAVKRTAGAHLVPVTVTRQDGAPTVYF